MPSPSTTRYIRYSLRISDTVYITQGIQRTKVSSSLCSLLTCNLSCLYFLTPFHNFLPLFSVPSAFSFCQYFHFLIASPSLFLSLSLLPSKILRHSFFFLHSRTCFHYFLISIFSPSGDVHGHRQRCDQVFSILRSFLLPLQRSILPRP